MKKAQSMAEYAILLAIFLAAIIAAQNYVKKSLTGRFKTAADQISEDQFGSSYNEISWSQMSAKEETGASEEYWSASSLQDDSAGIGSAAVSTYLSSVVNGISYEKGQAQYTEKDIGYNLKGNTDSIWDE